MRGRSLFGFLVKPFSRDFDSARREFILNFLLLGSIVISSIILIISFINDWILNLGRYGYSFGFVGVVLIFFGVLYFFSKKGKSRVVSYIFIGFYYFVITHLAIKNGVDIPEGLLIYSLIIVMSGVLVNSKFAFIVSCLISITLLSLTRLHDLGILKFESSWRSNEVIIIDSVVYSTTLFIIALVSWLFNKESEKALRRAVVYQKALQKERDMLEFKVEEKTRELKQSQAEKITQLYRFAEFGKLTSGFMHDISNSVNLVSMNLQELQKNDGKGLQEISQMIGRARVGTKSIENFISAARSQVNNQEFLGYFSPSDEVNSVIDILGYKAKSQQIRIVFKPEDKIKTFGNSIKFNQLVGNLLSNAIDSYDKSRKKNKIIKLELEKVENMIEFRVSDFGMGIVEKNLSHIFDPFFTTKSFEKGTGIGLSISQSIVTKDFGGQITVKSKPKFGTTFFVRIPLKKNT